MIISLKSPLEEYKFTREVIELASAFFEDFHVEVDLAQEAELAIFDNNRIGIVEHFVVGSKKEIYETFFSITNKKLDWGMLTGVRPVKLIHKLMKSFEELSIEEKEEAIRKKLKEYYFLSEEKIELLKELYEAEEKYISGNSSNMISVYIGIPFCPSRCAYCSFASNIPKQDRSDIQSYLNFLHKEISAIGEIVRNKGIATESIYIGGGTPGILSEKETENLVKMLREAFPGSKEITFEAGRPDVITYDKLNIALDSGANRICINPQTMNPDVLKACGRKHTPEDIISAFHIARKVGFENINMDLIIGLPEDNAASILDSLAKIIRLGPESITVHSLSLKKGSDFMENSLLSINKECPNIFGIIKNILSVEGYLPYYLYRQKHMWMNAENIGYAKEGYESIFNLQSMADKQTIIALGADAISKFITNNGVERFHNPKGLKEYEKNIEDLINKKTEMIKAFISV